MQAVILSIGDELILGQSVDTNAAWLSAQLTAIGILVQEHSTVGDDRSAIASHLRRAVADAEILIATGGLGPTDDDLTRYAVAEVLQSDLQLDENALRQIEAFYAQRDRTMPIRNRIQAMVPAHCEVIPNALGTAPGMFAEIAKTDTGNTARLFFLPGVPGEMKEMYRQFVEGRLKRLSESQGEKEVMVTRILHTAGASESEIAEWLGDMMARGANPVVNSTASNMIVSLRINARAADEQTAQALLRPVEQELLTRLGDFVFGYDGDTLSAVVGRLLRDRGETLAVAESCTGGWLGKEITEVPGSSDYFTNGWVVYSNEAKIKQLGVDREVLESQGAVSEDIARQLAMKAREKAETDYGIGITGIAGPGGGTQEKPVGLVYIALADTSRVEVKKYIFSGSRDMVRQRTVTLALDLCRRHITKLCGNRL